MKNIANIGGFRKIKLKPIKQNNPDEVCLVTVTALKTSSDAHHDRISGLRDRLDTIKAVAETKGYKWYKTEWVTTLIEENIGDVEKTLGIK